MKNKLPFLIAIILPFLGFSQDISQKLCGEYIALIAEKNSDKLIYSMNTDVEKMLRHQLINSPKCEFVPRHKLGTIASFFEEENRLAKLAGGIPSKQKQELNKVNVTQIGIISSFRSSSPGNSNPEATTVVTFFSVFEGTLKIELKESFPIDFYQDAPHVIEKRFNKKLNGLLDCDPLDEQAIRIKKEINDREKALNDLDEKQKEQCTETRILIKDYENKKKTNKKRRGFL